MADLDSINERLTTIERHLRSIMGRTETIERHVRRDDRRDKLIMGVLDGIQADDQALAAVVPQLLEAVQNVDNRLEQALAGAVDKAEVESIHNDLQGELQGIQQAVSQAQQAGGGASGAPGPSGAPGEGGSGATGEGGSGAPEA